MKRYRENKKKKKVKQKIFFLALAFLFLLTAPLVSAIDAVYNSTFGAPYCGDSGTSPCVAGSSLLMSVDSVSATPEPNQPNTIDNCADGTSGTYPSDESVENITITDLSNSNFLVEDSVQVNFTLHCYDTDDRYAVYYTNNVSSPSWQRITSGNPTCSGSGFGGYSETFNLNASEGYHAVRAIIEWSADITSACPSGEYSDKDDVVFNVLSSAGDSVAPNVTDLRPVTNSSYNVSTAIEIGANVTDDVEVDSVLANVTLPNGTVNQVILTNTSNWYNGSYSIPNLGGRYNVTFIANDSSGNVNSTEETYFVVEGVSCSPIFDEDWLIDGEEVCDEVVFDLGLGDIIIEEGGFLNLIGNSNFTAKSLRLNKIGDAVFIEKGSMLILG